MFEGLRSFLTTFGVSIQVILFSTNVFFFFANLSKIVFSSSINPPSAMTFLGIGLNAATALYFAPTIVRIIWRRSHPKS